MDDTKVEDQITEDEEVIEEDEPSEDDAVEKESEEESDQVDDFVADVEALLKKDKDSNNNGDS